MILIVGIMKALCNENFVPRQNRSPGLILAAKSGPPLPISVPHEI